MNIKRNLEEIGNLKFSAMLTVSRRGEGLYLTIPGKLERALNLRPKDQVEVILKRHYRAPEEEFER